MYGRVGYWVKEGIIGKHGTPGGNDNNEKDMWNICICRYEMLIHRFNIRTSVTIHGIVKEMTG